MAFTISRWDILTPVIRSKHCSNVERSWTAYQVSKQYGNCIIQFRAIGISWDAVARHPLLPCMITMTSHGHHSLTSHLLDCSFNRLFRLTTKKTPKLLINVPLSGESVVTSGFSSQRAMTSSCKATLTLDENDRNEQDILWDRPNFIPLYNSCLRGDTRKDNEH